MRAVLGRNRLMLAMAALAMAFAVALTVLSSPAAAQGGPNEECPAGTTEVLKIESQGPFEETVTIDGTEVTISGTIEGDTITFETDPPTPLTLVVKGGQLVEFFGPAASGTFTLSSGQDISNVKFCFGGTTTTTGTDTTTTGTGTDTTTTTGTDTTTTTGTDTTTTTGTDTTTTTGTGTDTTTTTGTGTDTTTTGTGTTTTGKDTTTTTGKDTTTTGKVTTTTGKDITTIDVVKKVGFTKFEGVKKTVFLAVEEDFFFIVVDKEVVVVEKDVIVFTEDVASAAQYQYEEASAGPGVLPDTGGSSAMVIAALALMLGGGIAAIFVMRRGVSG